MTRKYFGTDGIRGRANTEPMTATTALSLAMATAQLFRRGEHRHRVVIGKDTRLSGYLIEPALTAGFVAMGMDVLLLGPIPTPAVAMLTKSLRGDIGVMISASHNPYEDNGIKLFGPDGKKLSDELELKIESLMESGPNELAPPAELGNAARMEDARGRYVEFIKSTTSCDFSLEGLKIVVDCANGAAYKVAPTVLWELGAEVIKIGVDPNGRNINDKCGATNTNLLSEAVVLHGADIGIALDGDADRLIVVDEKGQTIDGDQLMALVAMSWSQQGKLKNNKLVTTVMSNLGLERVLAENGIEMIRTPVGDRYVVEGMKEHDSNVGGEQSGHIVLSDFSTTGDGLLAALQVLEVIQEKGCTASEACNLFTTVPQLLKSVRVKGDVMNDPTFQSAIKEAETELGSNGRLVVRKSGTENLVRVMAEGDNQALVEKVVNNLTDMIEA